MLPSAERLAATGLAIASITILALAVAVLVELDREAALHRDVIASLHAKDSLEALRRQLTALAHAASTASAIPGAAAAQAIERHAVEIDAELSYLAQHPARVDRLAFDALEQSVRALAMNARSVGAARARGPGPALAVRAVVERLAQEAARALDAHLVAQGARINDRTLAQLRVGESLRAYVWWLLAGSLAMLVALFGFYRWGKARERDALARIERLAHYDLVTGLPNRSVVADLLAAELARARREESGFAVLMFDLDGFKQVNDTRGHAAGDALLAMVAQRARASVRASDTVGRVGGDEFLALLPQAGSEGALQVAEKLRQSLAAPYALHPPVDSVSVSVGVSLFPQHGADAQALQRAADAALYAAKRSGRNRVVLAQAPPVAAETPAPIEAPIEAPGIATT